MNQEDAHANAVAKTAEAQEAVEVSREAQIKAAAASAVSLQAQQIEDAVVKALGRGAAEGRYVDTGRIPFICDDIKGIHNTLNDLGGDLKWIKWIGGGFVSAAGLLALKALGI